MKRNYPLFGQNENRKLHDLLDGYKAMLKDCQDEYAELEAENKRLKEELKKYDPSSPTP